MLRVLKNWSVNHKISVVMPKMGYQATNNILSNGISLYYSSNEKDEVVKKAFRLSILYFIRIVKSIFIRPGDKPDVIICASHFLYDIVPAIILKKRFKSKLVIYNHGILIPNRSYREGIRSNLMILNEKISLFLCRNSADLIFSINKETKVFLLKCGFDYKKIILMRNGVEHELINSVEAKKNGHEASYCGRLVKRKGVYDLIEVWENVLKYLPNSRLSIIGEGEELDNLKDLVSRKGLEKNIILTGYVPDEDKFALFKSSKLFVYPSYQESWGITLTEALACRLPVVCYSLSAYDFATEGIVRINLGDKKLMSISIVDLLNDEIKRNKLAEGAEKESKKLNWDYISEEELGVVHKLLQN